MIEYDIPTQTSAMITDGKVVEIFCVIDELRRHFPANCQFCFCDGVLFRNGLSRRVVEIQHEVRRALWCRDALSVEREDFSGGARVFVVGYDGVNACHIS